MSSQSNNIIRDLGEGLILRRSSPADAEALVKFNAAIHGHDEQDGTRVAAWTRDLLTRPHPTFNADDFTIVEESSNRRIVSSLNLVPQTWSYEGIEFGVGRPELVGTLPEFRGRGLVRVQFDEIHQWCLERGYVVQAITGIPYFYRQFGYEMALDLEGGRTGFEANVPKLKDGATEPFRFRRAGTDDIPFIMNVYKYSAARSSIFAVRDEAVWHYELDGHSEDSVVRRNWEIIERVDVNKPVGFIVRPRVAGNYAMLYELKPGVSWLEVTPSVVRHLWSFTKETAPDSRSRSSFTFPLGLEHPVYRVMGDDLPAIRKPYAYFIRVPDLKGFIRHIAPALEQRLASSIATGHSGELKICFYRRRLRLLFEQGKLSLVEDWMPSPDEWGNAAFPDLTFLQLLFGYRSFAELHQSFADCGWHSEADRALMDVLFPKKYSNVYGIA